jgi:elongation of very long chain fatty acids protein 4|eukprot:gene208-140_t
MTADTKLKSKSSEDICSSKDIKDTEKVFTSALVTPVLLVAGYLGVLRIMANYLEEEADTDPFKRVWWSGPIFFSIAYLLIVKYGVEYMKTREPFQIKPYIFTYNLYQCILNLWCVVAMIYEVYSNPIFQGMWGNVNVPGRPSFRIGFLVWIHYNNKYIELLDTMWMILRKKNNQISFLHCYHHVLLIWAWFLVCKIETGGDCYFGACVNSFIHVIMYGYYTLALLNVPCPWKKWITTCQMIQFCVCFSHSCYVVYNGNSPIILPLAQAFVMVNMLVLFGRFYMKSYVKKDDKKAVKEE